MGHEDLINFDSANRDPTECSSIRFWWISLPFSSAATNWPWHITEVRLFLRSVEVIFLIEHGCFHCFRRIFMNFVRTSVFFDTVHFHSRSGAFSRQVPHGAKSQWDEVCLPQAVLLKFWQIDLIKICLTRFSSAIWIYLKTHRVTTFIHFCRFFCSALAKQGRNKCLQIFLFALTLFFLSLLPHLDLGKLWTMFANIEIEYIMSELGLISLLGLPLFTLVPTHLLRSLFRLHSLFIIFPGYFLSFLTVVCFFCFLTWLDMLHGWLTEIEKLSSLPSKENWTSKTKHCQTHCEARAVSPYYQSICFANQQNNNNIWSIWPTLRTVTTSDYFRYSENDAIFLNAGDFVCSKTWEPCLMSHWAFVKALQPQGSNPRSSWCSLPQWLWWPESASDAIRRTNHINPPISKLA